METLTLVFWRVHFLPIPLCHWAGMQKLWEATVSSLDQPQTRPWGCRREHGVPNQTDRMAVTFCDCHPHGTRGIYHTIFRGQFWMPSIVPHYWWHLAAPRISRSEEWELILFIPGLGHLSRCDFSPHLGVMKIYRYPIPLSGPLWTGTAAVTWECWCRPVISRALSSSSGIYLS